MATTIQKKKSSKQRSEYLSDVRDALEHIVAVGSRIRHDGWRFDEWNMRREEQKLLMLQQNSTLPEHSPQEQQQVPTTTTTPPNLHAEDTRIYGTNGVPKEPWPKRRRRASGRRTASKDTDAEWNIEHGDTIHPLYFSMAKLSQLQPIEQQQQQLYVPPSSLDQDQEIHNNRMINGNNLHAATTNVTVSQDQVPRALVLKCWEQAVHAASCTVLAPIPCTTTVPTAAAKKDGIHRIHPTWQPDYTTISSRSTSQSNRRSNSSSPAVDNHHAQRDFSSAAAMAKCKSWKIDLSSLSAAGPTAAANDPTVELPPPPPPPARLLICPSCTLECETLEQLQRHYYGDDHHYQKGCCWILLASKHRSMMNQVLQRHVEWQAHQLLQVLLTKAKVRIQQQRQQQRQRRRNDHDHSNADNSGNQRQGSLLNWQDVLELAQSTLDSSSSNHLSGTTAEGIGQPGSPSHNHHPAWETLQVQQGKTCVVLNQYVLNAVQRRLMDRYANVPF